MKAVAKKKKLTRQIVFRVSEAVGQQLDELAARFGEDVSGLLRRILWEKLPEYKRLAEKIESGMPEED